MLFAIRAFTGVFQLGIATGIKQCAFKQFYIEPSFYILKAGIFLLLIEDFWKHLLVNFCFSIVTLYCLQKWGFNILNCLYSIHLQFFDHFNSFPYLITIFQNSIALILVCLSVFHSCTSTYYIGWTIKSYNCSR